MAPTKVKFISSLAIVLPTAVVALFISGAIFYTRAVMIWNTPSLASMANLIALLIAGVAFLLILRIMACALIEIFEARSTST